MARMEANRRYWSRDGGENRAVGCQELGVTTPKVGLAVVGCGVHVWGMYERASPPYIKERPAALLRQRISLCLSC